MNIKNSDLEFLKQLKNNKTLIDNITNLNKTQVQYKIKKINYLLQLFRFPAINLDRLGYITYEQESIDYLISSFNETNYSKEYRLNYIILSLLKQNYINKVEVQEFLQCSKSTIKNDFLELKTLLKSFNLSLKYLYHLGFVLTGDEKRIRDFFLNYFMNNFEFSRNEVILPKARQLMTTILKGKNSSFETSKIISLLLTIQYYRITHKKYIDYSTFKKMDFFNLESKNQFFYVNSLVVTDDLLDYENIFFEFYLNNLIYNKNQINIVRDYIFSNSLDIFIKNVGKILDFQLEVDTKLNAGLSNHIQALLFKKKNSIPVNKEDFDLFKKEYFSLYKAVHSQSLIFRNNFKVKFEDGDLLYISYHFLSAIKRLYKNKTKKILIVCNKGLGAAKILEDNLKSLFFVEIIDNISFYEYQMQDIKEADIVIHTIDTIKCNIPNIKVAPFISRIDKARIESLGCTRK